MKKLFILFMLVVLGLTGCSFRGKNCKIVKLRKNVYTVVCRQIEEPQCMIEPWMCGHALHIR